MSEQNRTLIKNWFQQVWNNASPDAVDQLFHPEGHCFGFPEPDSVLSPADFKAVHAQFIGAFSPIQVEVDDILSDGNRVAARFTCRMTHSGDALGFAATGKSVVMTGSAFCVCRDGKILDGWNFMDFTKVLATLQA